VPLRKISDELTLDFSAFTPAIDTSAGQSRGWSTLSATGDPNQQSIVCLWEDTMDISGISAADLSMVNLGGMATPMGPPNRAGTGNPQTVIDLCIATVTPLNLNASQWLFLALGAQNLDGPVDRQGFMFLQNRSFETTAGGGFLMPMLAMTQYAGATAVNTNRIFVYRLVAAYTTSFYNQTDGTAIPITPSGIVVLPAMMYQLGVELKDYDAISTAYAVYRGNELQQSYDNS
jgi:hypothetical protein